MPIQKITQQELIAKSIVVFRTKGYHATSMQDLATACGLTKGLFYHYHKSKKDLMLAVLTEVNSHFETRFFSKLRDNSISYLERKQIFIEKSNQLFDLETGGCIMGNTGLESLSQNPEFRPLLKAFFQNWEEAMVVMFSSKYDFELSRQKAKQAIVDLEGSLILMQIFQDGSYLKSSLERILT